MDDFLLDFAQETKESLRQLQGLPSLTLSENVLHKLFGVIQTLRVTAGFLELVRLERLAKAEEDVLQQMIEGILPIKPEDSELVLKALEQISALVDFISQNSREEAGDDAGLIEALQALTQKPAVLTTSLVRGTVLLCQAGSDALAVDLNRVKRIEHFHAANIYQQGDYPVIDYHGTPLMLVPLTAEYDVAQEGQQCVLVISSNGHKAGLMIDKGVDVVREEMTINTQGAKPGRRGHVDINGAARQMIDIDYYAKQFVPADFPRAMMD